jgi:hypothetical protein
MYGSAGDYASANFRAHRLAVLDPHPPRTWRRGLSDGANAHTLTHQPKGRRGDRSRLLRASGEHILESLLLGPQLRVALSDGSGEFGLVVPAITASALATVLALVLGSRAKARIERSRGFLRGRALATAAIVLGWIEVAAWILSPFIAGLVV